MLEQLKNATGVDIADLANISGGSDPAIPKELHLLGLRFMMVMKR